MKKKSAYTVHKAGAIPESAVRMAWYTDNAVRKCHKKKKVSYKKYREAMTWVDPSIRTVVRNMLAKPNEPEATIETLTTNPYKKIMEELYG